MIHGPIGSARRPDGHQHVPEAIPAILAGQHRRAGRCGERDDSGVGADSAETVEQVRRVEADPQILVAVELGFHRFGRGRLIARPGFEQQCRAAMFVLVTG